jgi:hypothetical protein
VARQQFSSSEQKVHVMASLNSIHSLVQHWFSSAPAILALALATAACGPADERPPPPVSSSLDTDESSSDLTEEGGRKDDDGNDDDNGGSHRCEEGDARECTIKLPKQGSVQNCIQGVRYCENGEWGKCVVD